MAKPIKAFVKLQIPAGKATPAPPVGTALGPHGLNLQQFCSSFNEQTRDKGNDIIPVEVTIFEDRSFTFVLKTPPAAVLLRNAAKVEKGSGSPLAQKVGKVTRAQVREIAQVKMPDLNTADIAAAMRTIEGTARQMGIQVVD